MLFCILLALFGCAKENPNPELLDPIFMDLQKQVKASEAAIKELDKKISDYKKELATIEPRGPERKIIRRELGQAMAQLSRARQEFEFYQIKSERRRFEGRRDYRIAFQSQKEWPDPKEYQSYTALRRLKSADRNWNKRVPKLSARNPNFVSAKKKPESKAEVKAE